jgi:UrcA family protein
MLTAAALASAASLTAGATAAQPVMTHYRIQYSHAESQTPQGARQLLRRINFAASQVCGGAPYLGDLNAVYQYDVCRAAAVDKAVRDADSPALSALAHGSAATMTLANGR